ncbi:MAG: InlB B-repeat-containing protein, partial [Bacilli bacterium]|nr:InlB B-repeat-containing protein [Bacilli bacterium]
MKFWKIKKALKKHKVKTRIICGLLASSIFICTFTGCSFKENTFTVSFDGNGGSLIAGQLNQKVTNSSEIVAPSFEMRGYTFDGWSIPLETITETTTVKAEWNIATYTINYHLDGGTNNFKNPNHFNILSDNIFLKDAIKNGYTFDYWSDSNGNKITTVFPADATNIDLYAHYKTVGYSITYELHGGTMTSTAPKTYNVESVASIPTAEKDGYTFLGWTTKQT